MKQLMHKNPQTRYLSKLIHELNQPITAIKAYLGGCELRLQRNDLSQEQVIGVLQKINEHAELLKNKINSLEELTTQERLIEEPTDLHSLITEIISLYSYEIEHNNIQFLLNFQEEFSELHINPFQIKQILFRLLKQCISTVEKNMIQKATLEIQTNGDKNTVRIIIKSNFLIKEEDFEKELTYCRTFLNKDNSTLMTELSANSLCFQLIMLQQR